LAIFVPAPSCGATVAGGMLTTGGARMASRAGGGALKAAASLSGTVGAAYASGGLRGVASATMGAPAARMAGAATAPVRDAYREGAAAGYRATAAPAAAEAGRGTDALGGGSGTPPPPPPAWAQNLARRQRLTQAGMAASQAVRDGDRPASTSGPELKDKS
jgi:type IV secretion system protein TrbL